MQIRKRTGELQEFDPTKIKNAIIKANDDTEEHYKIWDGDIDAMVDDVVAELTYGISLECCSGVTVDIEDVQNAVEFCLQREGYYQLAKNYIKYRYNRELAREFKKRDEGIMSLIGGTNAELNTENSNKNPKLASTMRDYTAGEVCKDLAQRILLPKHIVEAHNSGAIHFHDMDYSPAMPIFNCCLIDIKDMLDNGTCVK